MYFDAIMGFGKQKCRYGKGGILEMRTMLKVLGEQFPLEQHSAGEFAKIKVSGMNFTIEKYYVKGIGNVSLMEAKGFFGLMKMDTLIINPTECDMPLFSYDRVHAMGNDTFIVELYDTMTNNVDLSAIETVKAAYADLPDHDLGSHWYDSIKLSESVSKKGKKKETPYFDKLAQEYFKTFVELSKNAHACDEDKKREKASVYVEGLLSNGGPSTDIFVKHYGKEKTAKLFRNILFGTEK